MAGALHPLFPAGHFILPDTNVFLSQVRIVKDILFHISEQNTTDGPDRVNIVYAPDYPTTNCDGGSPTSVITTVQSFEGAFQNGGKENMYILQRVQIVRFCLES